MMDYGLQTENQMVLGTSHDLHYQQNIWLEMHLLAEESRSTAPQGSDGWCIEGMGPWESSGSCTESHEATDLTTLYPTHHDELPWYLELSQIPNQLQQGAIGTGTVPPGPSETPPIPDNSQGAVARHSISPGIDSTITEPAPHDMPSTVYTPSESDVIREEAAPQTRPIPASKKSPGNKPRKRSTVKKTKHGNKSKSKKRPKPQQLEQLVDDESCHREEVPPVLKNSCPEEERFIFERQWCHRHKSDEDMWHGIQGDFCERFNKNHSTDGLQIQLSRARSKYIQWSPEDVGWFSFSKVLVSNLTFNLGRYSSQGVGKG
jgi:hypothetical protein